VPADWLLAGASGVLLVLSFPKFGHPACAWVALAPLILAIRSRGPGRTSSVARAFWLSWCAAFIYFAGTLYWIGDVLAQFGDLPAPAALLGMVLAAAYLALYPSLGMAAFGACLRVFGDRGLVFAPAAWVAAEYVRGHALSGFPWVPLGNSQVEVLPIAQVASVVGVYGLSALVAAVNTLIVAMTVTAGRARVLAIAAAIGLVAIPGVWGARRIARGDLIRGPAFLVGLVQADIAQTEKWDPRHARRILTTYLAITRNVVARGARYVIWPESSTPELFEEDAAVNAAVRGLARELRGPILFGSDQLERGTAPRYYNAAFLLGEDGATRAVYRKMHLVPFGEFFPLQRWLSWFAPLVATQAPFAEGTSVVMLPVDGHQVSTAICYEVVFPELARQAVLAGSELLTTVTNDGWYGRSSAPYQHFAMASMRAIEQGRYLARAANTGISGFVDPYGRVLQRSPIFEEAGLVGEVRFLQERTAYAALGDVVPWTACGMLGVGLLVAVARPRGRSADLRRTP
jgi:apolipoprotein N-acyltransferase